MNQWQTNSSGNDESMADLNSAGNDESMAD